MVTFQRDDADLCPRAGSPHRPHPVPQQGRAGRRVQGRGAVLVLGLGPLLVISVLVAGFALGKNEPGMVANKLYFRISHYAKAGDSPVRLLIGLKNDGTIAGMQVSRAE